MITYYVCSALRKDGLFACEVYKTNKYIEDPGNLLCNRLDPIKSQIVHMEFSAAAFIDKKIYEHSVTRRTNWCPFYDRRKGSRFELTFGRYAVLKYLLPRINTEDRVIVSDAIYIGPLVRGAILPIDDYEHDLIEMCYQYKVYFGHDNYVSEQDTGVLSLRLNEIQPSTNKLITTNDLTGWITTKKD